MGSESEHTMTLDRYHTYVTLGQRGAPADVDAIMALLLENDSFSATRLADYALSLVQTRLGRGRIEHYLFHSPHAIQRNYAALYFKRRGDALRVRRAFDLGLIDALQAFAE